MTVWASRADDAHLRSTPATQSGITRQGVGTAGSTPFRPTTYATVSSALAIQSGRTMRVVGQGGSNPLAPIPATKPRMRQGQAQGESNSSRGSSSSRLPEPEGMAQTAK